MIRSTDPNIFLLHCVLFIGVERTSVLWSMKAIERADIVCVAVESLDGITIQVSSTYISSI